MGRLMSQRAAAEYCGIGRDRFRALLAAGRGPRVFNPDGRRALFAESVLLEWMHQRDDCPTTTQEDSR